MRFGRSRVGSVVGFGCAVEDGWIKRIGWIDCRAGHACPSNDWRAPLLHVEEDASEVEWWVAAVWRDQVQVGISSTREMERQPQPKRRRTCQDEMLQLYRVSTLTLNPKPQARARCVARSTSTRPPSSIITVCPSIIIRLTSRSALHHHHLHPLRYPHSTSLLSFLPPLRQTHQLPTPTRQVFAANDRFT